MDFLSPYLNSSMTGLVISIFLFGYFLLRRTRVNRSPNLAPFPAGAWPLIGHLPLLAGPEPPKYGPLFTLRLGLNHALVLSSWEMAKECFTTNDAAVSSRPKLVAVKHLGYNYAMFGFAPHGPYWRELRKIVTLQLLSNRRLELLSYIRVSEVKASVAELYKLWTAKNNGSGSCHISVELKQWFGDMSLNVILRMVAGKRYFSTGAVDDDGEARRCQKALDEFFHLLGLFVVSDAIPFLGWLDIGGHERAMKKTAKELDGFLGECLEEHKRKRASGGVARGEQDFMDVMLSILDGKPLAGYDADTIIKATSLTMIAGASDTSMVTLTWAISLLLNNLHVLKKAQDELDRQVGKERIVDESDIEKLVFLRAIVKETLRLYPPAPLSAPREFMEDCTIGGYQVPKGTRLITNTWKIQTDPRIWSNPLNFEPERFLTTHKDVDVRGQHFELIPFGSGRRACPGTSFALQMVHLALASFLHMYEISTPSNAPVDMSERFGITNVRATPLEVLVTPRLPSELYGVNTV
ncbi:cytochrome P450 CYP82D47-like [Corylus avellana]|uniref:cytochrome P450 CYP82D47-like n=1 Tax=Corylus avellana TaxID=13451 RepID=UPI001E2188D2|nr:cytochrome P450 CYP82D47-like [Corylus avellana]XP_059434823.1 cytochrome P450 CYP82D47-like [Corylus avellana]